MEDLARSQRTVVIYESPNRVEKTLGELLEVFGSRPAVIARELTKIYEEVVRGSLEELISTTKGRKWKGEITLIISGNSKKSGEKEK